MFFLAAFSLVTLINAQVVVNNRLSKLIPATYPPDLKACANSTPDRSFSVNYQAQCVYDCQHGDEGQVCLGVNFQQLSKSCDIYNNCPTSYILNSPGCLFIQKSNQTGEKVCPVSVACDGNCTSGCAQLGPFKCDSRCKADYGLTTDNTCQPCDAKCSSGCFVQGAGRCDSMCVFGFALASNYSCQACDARCSNGCPIQGPGKCESLCITGYGIASDHTCQACAVQCASGCPVQGAWKCDSLCNNGYGIAADGTCKACDVQCSSGCNEWRAGKCDSQCYNGYGIAADHTCQACGSNCASGCSAQGAGKCDSACTAGYVLRSDYSCRVNLAKNRVTCQISTYSTAAASLAVDGDFATQSCTANYAGSGGWWAVDLGQAVVVTSVMVTNDPIIAGRLNYFIVGVTNTSPCSKVGSALSAGTDFTVCTQYCCSLAVGATAEVWCTPSSTAYRFVIIQGTISGQPICLNEVQVFS